MRQALRRPILISAGNHYKMSVDERQSGIQQHTEATSANTLRMKPHIEIQQSSHGDESFNPTACPIERSS